MNAESNYPLFGRKWELQVLTPPTSGNQQTLLTVSSSAWEPESLRMSFDICKVGYKDFWYGDITIYNLNLPTAEMIVQNQGGISQGCQVKLNAGYQAGENYGNIFMGRVFQPIWDRENVTDYRLTLRCIVGLSEVYSNIVASVGPAGMSQRELLLKMMREALGGKIDYDSMDTDRLGVKVLPRGKVMFGSAAKYLDQAARDNNLQFWVGDSGVALGDIQPKTDGYAYAYSAPRPPSSNATLDPSINYTIIDTPQQTQDGITFRVMLDPRLTVKAPPAMQVKIDQTVIRQMSLSIGTLPPVLSKDGIYMVGGVRHVGDTRDSTWFTEVTGYTSVAGVLGMLGQAAAMDPNAS